MFRRRAYYVPEPSRYPPQAIQYPSAPPHAYAAHNPPALTFDDMMGKRYADSDKRLWSLVKQTGGQCSDLLRVSRLRIHKNLFVNTYVHLVSCYGGSHVHRLVDMVNGWKNWDSVQQLAHHSSIRNGLLSFWTNDPCRLHKSLFLQQFIISDDESDLLCHLLYCRRKPELYELSSKPGVLGHSKGSEQVIELLWKFLMNAGIRQDSEVACRLYAQIYRMARKSAYIPRDLQIKHASIHSKRVLGSGANGTVMQAVMNGQHIVIKKILCSDPTTKKECLEMFSSEAILWKTMNHKNIVPFLGVVTEGAFDIGLVSPFYKNRSVKIYMKNCDSKRWPVFAKTWARDLAEGLLYIHCHKPTIIHGDLKGDNVLVDDDGHARLGDFGQSHASDSGRYLDSTRVGLMAHNPVYWMAPEIITGGDHAKASDKSDIYSFGCVLYEMVSGKIPFEEYGLGDVIKRVTSGEHPKRPKSISEDDLLWKISKHCWAGSPEVRPTARDIVSLLH